MEGTFSIIAYDPRNGDIGVAVASKVICVGGRVPYGKAGVGIVVTQSFLNGDIANQALSLMEIGYEPKDIIPYVFRNDPILAKRQFALINNKGVSAAFTGNQAQAWAGHRQGLYYSVQGNIIVSENVVNSMAETFEKSRMENPEAELGAHLLAALEAGQNAGGDTRGKQSAALLVVRPDPDEINVAGKYVDLRVDDHSNPIEELKRLYQIRINYIW